jgi:hypothetical protein
MQPPAFAVADLFYQSEAYGPERAATSQSALAACCFGADDVDVFVAREIAMVRLEEQDD